MRITLKRAYADGTVAVEMDPLSLLYRLATSVPPPRYHTRVGCDVLFLIVGYPGFSWVFQRLAVRQAAQTFEGPLVLRRSRRRRNRAGSAT